MLTLTAGALIFLCKEPINMRNSFEGLSAAVEQLFPGELFTGALFIFLNRTRSHMKALFWDRPKRRSSGNAPFACANLPRP